MRRALVVAALLGSLAQAQMNNMSHAGMAHTPSMSSQMQGMLAPLRPLRGKAFDIKWTQLMIDHHQMALEMAQHELGMGQDRRVKAAAQKVIDSQRGEITTMQGWLKSWTGKGYTPKPMPMQMAMDASMDRQFLQGMIPHHQGAVDMSRLIPARTHNPQLRQLGMQIIRTQTAEMVQYRQLLKTVK